MKKNLKTENFVEELYFRIAQSAKKKKVNSYTKKLLKAGPKKIANKIGEESSELIIDYLKGSKKRIIEETADLFYHVLLLLYSKKIDIKNLKKELKKRRKND